ncbi:quinon protein alcohol dehydrogenase-like superfamily [Sordaria brevicollis]|uniref:Quinon protein alcohol dehydrogenase-like superfamily n=1 Tax=Sordaria brevicollis TaxID=83679 RepID=A0AAE0PKF6_SORBR|nr:quinon protein alcohol dehydrogenase-like superfamily [Sordaria brevicollis]
MLSLSKLFTLILVVAPAALAVADASSSSSSLSKWTGWGGNFLNNRWQPESALTVSNIESLSQVCNKTYPFGVSATPVIEGNMVYYPTWNGDFVALDYTTCQVKWSYNVTQLTLDYAPPNSYQILAYTVSRTSPQIDGNIIYFGTQRWALMVAMDKRTGTLLDTYQVNPHPLAVITQSPTFHNGILFVGTGSYEEPAPLVFPGYKCCTFIGNFIALTFSRTTKKFTLKWDVPTLPSNTAWSGAGVWGSQPSIDESRNQVFFATGNVYSFPPEFAHCANQTSECMPRGVNQEAIIAVDISTGKENWVRRITKMDAWNGGCVATPIDKVNCAQEPPGNDGDFGMAPSFVSAKTSGLEKDVVIAGQKNANIYALDAETGKTVWQVNTSPDFQGGGISWGVAVDDEAVYYNLPYGLGGTNGGLGESTAFYGAVELRTGRKVWEVRVNETGTNSIALTAPTVLGKGGGSKKGRGGQKGKGRKGGKDDDDRLALFPRTGVMDANGAYFYSQGALVFVEKRTGRIVKELVLDTNFNGGIAVQGRYVMFGTGYRNGQSYLGNGTLHVYRV